MKNFKRFLSLALAVLMTLSYAPTIAYAMELEQVTSSVIEEVAPVEEEEVPGTEENEEIENVVPDSEKIEEGGPVKEDLEAPGDAVAPQAVLAPGTALERGKYVHNNGFSQLDLGGATYEIESIEVNGGTLVISNGTLIGTNSGFSTIAVNGGSVILENVTVSGARHAVRAEGGDIEIYGGNYSVKGTAGLTTHALNVSDGSTVTIHDGTFTGPQGTNADSGAAVNVQTGSTVIIKNGNFSGGKLHTLDGVGTITVEGGTFDQDPSAYLSGEYTKAFEKEGKWTVNIWDGKTITNVYDLLTFAEAANEGNNFSGKTVTLAADIDLGGMTWTPIKNFLGTFNGNGKTISNFHLDATKGHAGFFYKIDFGNGTAIKDLTLSDITATVGNYYVGALAYFSFAVQDNITIKNFTVTTTASKANVGGYAGWVEWGHIRNCTIENMTVNAENGAGLIGGLAAVLKADNWLQYNNIDVKGFKVTINDTDGIYAEVGGLVGQTQTGHDAPVFTNCDITGIDVTATGLVTVGGFIARPGAHTTAKNCTTEGKIDVTGVTSADEAAGGFFGNLGWNNNESSRGGHKLTDCSADVDIVTKIAPAGGFVGSATNEQDRNMAAAFTNCSASGEITLAEGGTANIGGFAGEADRGTYNECYYTGDSELALIGGTSTNTTINNSKHYIKNVAELQAFAAEVNAGNKFEGITVLLTADIDLAGIDWTPIGNDTNYFWGTFDGQNHTISNMTININTPEANVFAGLFGGIKKATIKNLVMEDVKIDAVGAKVRAAAVVGIASSNSENRTDATINFENITVDGCTINAEAKSGSALVGGVVGYSYPANMSDITVSDLTIDAKAEGNEVRAAAINGYICGQNISNNGNTRATMLVDTFDVKNVSITADAYTVFAGGYAPYTYYGYITLENGTIDGLKIKVDAHEAFVGGLVGYFWRSDNGHTVKNVAITGIDFDVTTDYLGETRVGGVVGTSQSPRTTYTDVSVSGKIVERCSDPANPVNYHAKVGGFVARTYEYAQQTYTRCVADVDVTGSNVAGGFVGNHNSTVSYVDCEAKGDVTANIAGGFAGRLTEHGYTTDVTFDGCKASGAVTGTNVAGGFIGSTKNHGWAAWAEGNGTAYGKNITLNNCTASSTVTGENYVAGVIGEAGVAENKEITFNNVSYVVEPAYLPKTTTVTIDGVKYETFKVSNKDELNDALGKADDGDTILFTADIDYGTDQLKIEKAITLDLGGKTLTTRNAYGGMALKNNPTIKNGTIVHASNTAAIKAWNVASFEDLTIDVQGKGDANKTIGGIVVQSGATNRIETIKNVTIKGEALTNGIETYNCGDATQNVIGSMENVTIEANGTGMLISAPCGTATNCNIKGGVSGIEIWIKGNYSATLDLVNCTVEGGKQAVYAHDEFSSNPDIVNNGELRITIDDDTDIVGAPLTLTIARAENVNIDEQLLSGEAKLGDTYYATFKEAVAAANAIEGGATVTLLKNVTLSEKLIISGNVTISGEKTITRDAAYTGTLFEVAAGATLTLDGGLVIDGNNNWTLNTELYNKALNREITGVTWAELITSEEGKPNATAPMFKVTGSVIANKVTIQNNYSSKDSNNGDYGVFQIDANATLTMTGATVKHIVTGGANSVAHLSTNSVWTINDGSLITDTFAGKNGGVCRNDSGKFVMNGGTIEKNNSINTNGTVIMLYKGSMEMNGGKICSNTGISGTANGRCAPIYGHSTSTFVMNNGEICHNTGISYGGVDVPSSIKVEINGGYVGDNISALGNTNKDVNGNANTVITGGTFTQDVSAWLAPGCGLVYDEVNKVYGITKEIAEVNGVKYESVAEAVAAANDGDTITVLVNHTMDDGDGNIAKDKNVTLDLNGKTVRGSFLAPNATLTVQNGTIINNNSNASAIEINAGELVLDNVNISSARHAVRIDGAVKATINSGKYTLVGSNLTQHVINVSKGADVTIKGGEFIGAGKVSNIDSGAAVNAQADSKVTIEGGNFSGGKLNTLDGAGTITVTGGTFDQDPSARLASGYKATENEGIWTVSVEEGYFVKSFAELKASIESGKTAIEVVENITVDEAYTIPENVKVTVADGKAIRVLDTLTNNGTIEGNVIISVMVYTVEEREKYDVKATQNGSVTGNGPSKVSYEISLDGGENWIADTTKGKAQAVTVKTDGTTVVSASFQSAFTSAKTGETVHMLTDAHVQSTNPKKNNGPLRSYYGLILEGNGHTIFTDLESSGASNEYATIKFTSYLAGTGPEVNPVLKNVTIDSQKNAKADLDIVSGDVTFTVDLYNVKLLGNCQYASFAMKSPSLIINKSAINIYDSSIPSWDASSAKEINFYSGEYSLTFNSKCTVYGGTYTKDPTNYLAEGLMVEKNAEGKYVVAEDPAYGMVAKVGDVYYESLTDALNACTNGETVEIIDNITYDADDIVPAVGGATGFGKHPNPSIIYVGGTKGATDAENQPSKVNAVIDLKGHTITNNADAYLFLIMDNAKVKFTDSVGGGEVITEVDAPAIWVTGTDTLVTIDGGYYKTASATGLLHCTHGGDLVITGGEFETTAADASLLIMLNTKDRKNPEYFVDGVATVTISGGTFHGFNPEKVGDDNGASSVADIKFVDGCADGYVPVDNNDGTYGVKEWYDPNATTLDIHNKAELLAFAYVANNGNNFSGKTINLMADIDLEGMEWAPIKSFAGNFVGNNKTISNFQIDATASSAGFFETIAASNGLEDVKVKDLVLSDVTATVGAYRFGTLANSIKGVVHNVTVKNVTVTTTHTNAWVGGMCAFMDWPWMTNCTVENLVVDATKGADLIGGFACILQKNSNHVFDNLDVKGFKVTVTDTDSSGCRVGGFVAQTQRGWENPKVINSDITGIDVTATVLVDVGGFIAWPGAHTIAENCTTEGKIDVTGVTSADCFAGGFFGNLGWNADLGQMGHVVTDCTANVEIITKVANAGGFVGSATNSNDASMYATFNNCEAKGNITAVEGATADIGGFFGDADRGVYNNCTASGTVTNNGTGNAGWFGGAIYNVTPKYDHRYPAGTRDYLVDVVTLEDITYEGASTSLDMIGFNEKADEDFEEITNVAAIGETKYATLADAIEKATAGDTIIFLTDIEENVTVNKNLTIDGKEFKYTGTMTVSGNVNVTVQDINAVKGYINHTGTNATGKLTVKGCSFADGGYAVTTARIASVTIEDCTVTNQSLLYARLSTPSVTVKNVTVDNGNYVAHLVYGSTAYFENVVATNMPHYGICTQNHGAKTITLKNCSFETVGQEEALHVWDKATAVDTFVFEGTNEMSSLHESQYAKYVLAEETATLKAPAGFNVTSGVEGLEALYNNGTYFLGKAVAAIGETKYASVQEAINAAKDNDTIKLLVDIDLAATKLNVIDDSYDTYFLVEGKTVTVDFDGHKITGKYTTAKYMLVGVFSTDNGGHLTLTGNGTLDVTTAEGSTVYSLIANYEDNCSITIENGTYKLDKAKDCLLYTGSNEGIVVNDGNFTLGNVGEGTNGMPWIFNALYSNANHAVVNGGTFNADVNHQFWANEVYVPENLALKDKGDETWTVVEAAAYVIERATSSYSAERKVGYATLAEAVKAVKAGKTVTLLKNLDEAIALDKAIVLELNNFNLTGKIDLIVKEAAVTAPEVLDVITSVTGGMVVYEEGTYKVADAIAEIVETKETFTTVSEALAKAAEGQTVKLLKGTAESFVTVKPFVTFDLNGHTFEVDYFVGMKDSDVVDNSAENSALLKVAKDNVALDINNADLPIWNNVDGYEFFTVHKYRTATNVENGKLVFSFKPYFTPGYNGKTGRNELVLTNGAANSNLTFAVRVSFDAYDEVNGEKVYRGRDSRILVYSEEHIKTVLNGAVFNIIFTGIDGLENIDACGVIISGTRAEAASDIVTIQ